MKQDGTVWAWGGNEYGELGNGTNTDSNVPVQVSGLTGITAIAGGGSHSLALKQDGTVWAWGGNEYGELGNGTNTNSNVPIQVLNLSGIIGIAGGGYHSLAIYGDGCPTITLSPSSLPSGTVGTAYSQTISASGGISPYTFAITSGSLPAGLTLSATGTLSGTPTAAGSYTFEIKAVDSKGCFGTKQYTMSVTVNPPVITSVTKMTNPFRLKVLGGNFHYGCVVQINGQEVPTTYKSSNKIIAKKGDILKVLLPKNVPVQITVLNKDDGGVPDPMPFVR